MTSASPSALTPELAHQYVALAMAAVLTHMQLPTSGAMTFGGSIAMSSRQRDSNSDSDRQQQRESTHSFDAGSTTTTTSCTWRRGGDSVHQTGTKYRSNNAGDGPEKTRDRKSWFPRFKSNWLGTYRSKQMFHCCECAVVDAASARYKGAEGKHCACGQDEWHRAKTIEEAEYNRRMEISKALGGLRYDEALERLKAMGTSEHDLKRLRCESDEASSVTSSCSSIDDSYAGDMSATATASKRIKNEPTLPSPATRTYGSQLRRTQSAGATSFGLEPMAAALPSHTSGTLTAELLQKINHSYSAGLYTPLGGDYVGGPAAYDHLVPVAFADEESFGELLQGFLEDDPRNSNSGPYGSYQQQLHSGRFAAASTPLAARPAPHYTATSSTGSYGTASPFLSGSTITTAASSSTIDPRYLQAPSTLPPPPIGDVDFEFFADGQTHQQHQQHVLAHHQHRSGVSSSAPAPGASGYFAPHIQSQLPYSARPHLAHPQHSSIV